MRCLHRLGLAIGFAISALLIFQFLAFCSLRLVYARDGDDHGNHGPLKPWFDQLASKKGLCCSFADGVKVEDVDWDVQDGKYRVRLCPGVPVEAPKYDGNSDRWINCAEKAWIVVPDEALITEPNRFGPAVVWPYPEYGVTKIRCFMPGAGT